jgi:hypothetical protein
MESRSPSAFSIVRDALVVGGILAGVNYLTSREDPGWLSLNPTPWLLLPLLLGSRYGLVPGVLSGGLATGIIAWAQMRSIGDVSLETVARAHPFYYSCLVLVGLLAGVFRRASGNRLEDMEKRASAAEDRLDLARSELHLVREGRAELQQALLLQGTHLNALDEDLKKVFTSTDDGHLIESLLGVMHRHSGIVAAAMYRVDGNGRLTRIASLDEVSALPLHLNLEDVPVAAKALDEQILVSVEAPLGGPVEQEYLAAIPWTWKGSDGVLLVQDMPLRNFTWEHLSQMELVLKWALSLDTLRSQRSMAGDPEAFVALEDFLFLLNEALVAEQTHQLPSVVCRADFIDAKEAADVKLVRQLLIALPKTAVPTRLPSNGSIIALLPFGGEPEGAALGRELQACGAKLKTSQMAVIGPADVADFWSLVTKD